MRSSVSSNIMPSDSVSQIWRKQKPEDKSLMDIYLNAKASFDKASQALKIASGNAIGSSGIWVPNKWVISFLI